MDEYAKISKGILWYLRSGSQQLRHCEEAKPTRQSASHTVRSTVPLSAAKKTDSHGRFAPSE